MEKQDFFFSLYALHRLLPPEHFECMFVIVEACLRILGHGAITRTDCMISNHKMDAFCVHYERLSI